MTTFHHFAFVACSGITDNNEVIEGYEIRRRNIYYGMAENPAWRNARAYRVSVI